MRQRIARVCVAIVCFAVCVIAVHHHDDDTDFSRSCAICNASKISFAVTNGIADVFQLCITYVSTPEETLITPRASTTPSASRAPPA